MLNTIDKEIYTLFADTDESSFSSFTQDSAGNKVGFLKSSNGDSYLIRKNKNQSLRAIKYLEDGSKIIFVKESPDGFPSKHVFAKDNSEMVFKYDSEFNITEITSYNADASIFRTSNDTEGSIVEIYDEINHNGKTFTIKKDKEVAFINIDRYGKIKKKGSSILLSYLKTKFQKELKFN
jgi:hypothetical protein